MKFLLVGVCSAFIALLPGCAPAQSTTPAPKPTAQTAPLRVLTLGDSLTDMFRYQPFLRETLQKEGIPITFVGTRGEVEKKHEGHSGWSIGQIEDKTLEYLAGTKPDVVLLQIGINNLNHGLGVKGKNYPPFEEGVPAQGAQTGKTLDELGATWGDKTYGSGYLTTHVNGLLDKITDRPDAPLLVVTKILGIGLGNPKWKAQNDDCDARVREFNRILETAVKTRQAKGAKIEIVDNYALGNRAYGEGAQFTWGNEKQQSSDWVHPRPDAVAWQGMATNFAAGVQHLTEQRLVKP